MRPLRRAVPRDGPAFDSERGDRRQQVRHGEAKLRLDAVNNRDKNFTTGKVARRWAQLEESVARYLAQLDTADRQEPTEALAIKALHLKENAKLESEMLRLSAYEHAMLMSADKQVSLTDPDSRSHVEDMLPA